MAPFDGVVTARRIDVGALVSATNTGAKALFDISDISRMRVYVHVPQVYAASMHKGLKVSLSLPQYSHRTFEGALDTTSNAISDVARALLVEAIFPNQDALLSPGAYAEARFNLPLDPHKLVIPSSAMVFRGENPEVAVVKDGKIVLTKVAILVDTGPEIEISTGLEPDDKIVLNPSYAMETGEEVNVVKVDGKRLDAKAVPQPSQQRVQAEQ